MVILAIHLESGLESDNWNKKNLEFGTYVGFGAVAAIDLQPGLRKDSVHKARDRWAEHSGK